MAQAAEVQFPQPLAPPENQDGAAQAEHPPVVPAQAAPAPQPVQNNADEAQNEHEVNSVFFGFLYFSTLIWVHVCRLNYIFADELDLYFA